MTEPQNITDMYDNIRKHKIAALGKPLYPSWEERPFGHVTKMEAKEMGKPVGPKEKPVAYWLSKSQRGYEELFDRISQLREYGELQNMPSTWHDEFDKD